MTRRPCTNLCASWAWTGVYKRQVWDACEAAYQPVYAERREQMQEYQRYQESTGRESLVAAYNLYSESRIG